MYTFCIILLFGRPSSCDTSTNTVPVSRGVDSNTGQKRMLLHHSLCTLVMQLSSTCFTNKHCIHLLSPVVSCLNHSERFCSWILTNTWTLTYHTLEDWIRGICCVNWLNIYIYISIHTYTICFCILVLTQQGWRTLRFWKTGSNFINFWNHTTQTACTYIYHAHTVQSGIGNCMSSAKAVVGSVCLNAAQPNGYYRSCQFNMQKLYVLITLCIYVFCVNLRTNSNYFPIQH